jgi:hypothetical protein
VLIKIAELERKYEVVVISTNERVGLDTSDPDIFMKRAFDYLMANRELLNIRARVRLGRINAMEHGRYFGKATYGYRNVRSETEECYIEITQAHAKIVRRIFRDYLLGIDPAIIHANVKESGFSNYGKNAIHNVLRNCRIVEHRLDRERSRKKTSIERKIFQLEEKFIDNLIEHSVYQNWSIKLNLERSKLEEELKESKAGKAALQFDIDNLLSDKVGLFGIYTSCNAEQKHMLIHVIFRDTLTWEDNNFAASFFNPSLNHSLKTILKMISIKGDINTTIK